MEGLTEHEQLFFNDGYQLGKHAARDGYREEDLFQALQQMYHGIDQLIESLSMLAERQGSPVHCKKGCAFCCHQAVFANSYELHYLGNFMNKHFSETQKLKVQQSAIDKNKKTSALDEEEVLNFKSPCPLLRDGTCSAYEARPMACRIYLSTSVNTCIEFYNNPKNKNSYPALLDFPLMAGRMMNEGFISALKEHGIEIAEFRLEDGIKNLLK